MAISHGDSPRLQPRARAGVGLTARRGRQLGLRLVKAAASGALTFGIYEASKRAM